MPDILAFDLGGSSLRLAIVADDGTFRGTVRQPLEFRFIGARGVEADPRDWWNAFLSCCTELERQGHDFTRIGAVAGCGFTRTQVFLDEGGAVIRPAIAFQDTRAAEVLEVVPPDATAGVRDAIAGLGPFDPLARLLWVKATQPEVWSRLRKIVEPKDYVNLMLTGIAVSDVISQAPMRRVLDPAPDLLVSLSIDHRIVPDARSPFDPLGLVREGLPTPLSDLAGTPVYCGSIDTWACVLGSGGMTPGVAYGISGTSDVSGVISAERRSAEGLLSVEWAPGLWQLGGPSQGAATRLQWAADLFDPGAAMEDALDRALVSGDPAPLVLPYLDGERTPWWDADLQGAILGLSSSHHAPDLMRGVAEGLNYLSREVLRRAEEAIGTPVDHVCFSGGLSASTALCQLKADVLDRVVVVPVNRETGLMGAARIVRQVWGLPDAAVADDSILYTPDPGRRCYHDNRFALFLSATEVMRPISHHLNPAHSPFP